MPDISLPDMTVAEQAGKGVPAPLNMLTAYQNAQNLRGSMLQNQLLANQNQNFQSQLAAGRDYQSSIGADGQLDPNQLAQTLANDPQAALQAEQMHHAALGNALQQLQNQGVSQENVMQRLKWAGNALGTLLTKDNPTQKDIISTIGDGVSENVMPAKEAAALVQQIPTDPTQIKPWLAQHYAQAQGTAQALNAHLEYMQNGSKLIPTNTNPMALNAPLGTMPGVAPIQETLTPGQAVQPVTVNGQGGTPYTATMGQIAQNGLPGAQNGVVTGQSTQEQAANAQSGSQFGNMTSSIFANTQGLASSRAALAGINSELGSANPGPLADTLSKIGGSLSQLGINGLDQATAYQLLQKGSAQAVIAQVGSGLGVPTDNKMGEIMAATPNGHMTSDAVRGAVGQIQGILDYKQAEALAAQHAGIANNPAMVTQFQNAWAQRFPNASVFQFQHLPEDLQKKYWQSMAPAERKAFYGQLNEAAQLGYTSAPQ